MYNYLCILLLTQNKASDVPRKLNSIQVKQNITLTKREIVPIRKRNDKDPFEFSILLPIYCMILSSIRLESKDN